MLGRKNSRVHLAARFGMEHQTNVLRRAMVWEDESEKVNHKMPLLVSQPWPYSLCFLVIPPGNFYTMHS